PGSASRSVKLGGNQKVRQYFQPTAAQPLRTAVLSFVGNTSGEDIGDATKKIEGAFAEELFKSKAFKQVPAATALNLLKQAKLSIDKLKTSGWRGSVLADEVDVVVFGSVSRSEGDSFVAEVGFYQNDGALALTQAVPVGSSGSWRVGRATSEIVSNIMTLYPFSGTVLGSGDEGYKVNLSGSLFPLDSDDQFSAQSVKRDGEGLVVGYTELGILKMQRTRDDHSMLQEKSVRAKPVVGDRVVRIDAQMRDAKGSERSVIAVRSADGAPLRGANVYIDQRWAGSTDRKGELSAALRPGSEYKLLIYRHGYEQMTKPIEPAKGGERFEFALRSYSSSFTVESEPSGAAVSIDDGKVGSTPITKGIAVTRGFHTVKVDAGGDYRAWEEVLEFSQKEEARTGANRIVLYKDFLRQAERAEAARNVDEAIKLYAAAPKGHPDYSEIHSRLGQLYFDQKQDYERAIAEFESVQAVPEVRELVYKQFSVLYTNLGKAYYAKGEKLYRGNRNEALQLFAKAIKALDRARENTRFFPNERHDEAVHDTYYYRAMAYHNLYVATKRDAIARELELAWNEYFDFFPEKLRGKPEFERLRESGEKLAQQMKE
ncbi:MAG: PEGA domain-containing protein, partial [Betaproteobacteria bacterium]|nr:PEGA domain-containing protein [Betaproteobacteria bacterium]